MTHAFFGALTVAALVAGPLICGIVAGEAARNPSAAAPAYLPFDFYPRHREELALNEAQILEMQQIADGMRKAAVKFEAERAQRTRALQELVAKNPIDLDKAMESFRAVLSAENELKALQFRGGIMMRNALSPEQIGKLKSLARKESASRRGEVRAEFHERLQLMKREVQERLGGGAPREMIEQIQQIEEMAKEGRLGDAKNLMEQVLRQLRGQSGETGNGKSDGRTGNP